MKLRQLLPTCWIGIGAMHCTTPSPTTSKTADTASTQQPSSQEDSGTSVDTFDSDSTQEETQTSTETESEQTTDTETTTETDSWAGILLSEAIFQATHNSYSGEERGSIVEQLNHGIRGLEFDIHDNNFAAIQDYQLGHHSAGGEVDNHQPNPSSVLLTDWLQVVNEWSTQNPSHAPITITLDLKDDLTDNHSHTEGGFSALNNILADIFGNSLYSIGDTLPTLDQVRGKIIIILSGHEESRKLYKRDRGHNPAIAINEQGQVIEVHDSGSGALWYWTGQLQADSSIIWYRHGRYDSGAKPAIDLNNNGHFVEVHQSENQDTLWFHAGYIDADYLPHFGPSEQFDNGVEASIRFVDKNANTLREIHQSENTGLHWDWWMELNPNTFALSLGQHNQTNDPLFDKSTDGSLAVSTAAHQTAPADTLLYSYDNQPTRRIRYPQLASVELQPNNASELDDHECHFAAAGNRSAVLDWINQGKLTRIWEFSENDAQYPSTFPTYPAVDTPYDAWYAEFCSSVNCIQ